MNGPGLGIGYVPQGRGIFPNLSVRTISNRLATLLRRARKVIEASLEDFPRLRACSTGCGGALVGRRAATAGAGPLPDARS
jgi:amidase